MATHDALQKLLSRTFGFASFRTTQREVIEKLLSKNDAIAVFPTGAGKSLTYQFVAAAGTKLVIVVSPLVALMKDQVEACRKLGVPGAALWSGQSTGIRDSIYDDLASSAPRLRLLFVTPEGIKSKKLTGAIQSLYSRHLLSLFAVDEAHCISTFGHDFRPAYRELSRLREKWPAVPIVALTATATQTVIADIAASLKIPHATLFKSSFDRPNLKYSVAFKDLMSKTPLDDLEACIRTALAVKVNAAAAAAAASSSSSSSSAPPPSLAIVYVSKREDASEVASQLRMRGIRALAYHAGLSEADRNAAQDQWSAGSSPVCVATIAFGMGVDAPRVRFVGHWSLPKSIENYQQESGRGGRDQAPSACRLYYSRSDAERLLYLATTSARKPSAAASSGQSNAPQDAVAAISAMVQYCETAQCRRLALLQHFGEKPDFRGCKNSSSSGKSSSSAASAAVADGPLRELCDYCVDPEGVSQGTAFVKSGASQRHNAAAMAAFAARVSEEEERIADALHGGGHSCSSSSGGGGRVDYNEADDNGGQNEDDGASRERNRKRKLAREFYGDDYGGSTVRGDAHHHSRLKLTDADDDDIDDDGDYGGVSAAAAGPSFSVPLHGRLSIANRLSSLAAATASVAHSSVSSGTHHLAAATALKPRFVTLTAAAPPSSSGGGADAASRARVAIGVRPPSKPSLIMSKSVPVAVPPKFKPLVPLVQQQPQQAASGIDKVKRMQASAADMCSSTSIPSKPTVLHPSLRDRRDLEPGERFDDDNDAGDGGRSGLGGAVDRFRKRLAHIRDPLHIAGNMAMLPPSSK